MDNVDYLTNIKNYFCFGISQVTRSLGEALKKSIYIDIFRVCDLIFISIHRIGKLQRCFLTF